MIFDNTDKNKELLEKYDNVFSGIMSKIEYTKGYKKIKFNSDDNLPLNKQSKFHTITVTIRYVFSEDKKLYPQLFLDEALHSL